MKINAVIPAKGKTSRIDNRNLYRLGSQSLVYLACEKLLNCVNIDEVYLDTECSDIAAQVKPLISKGLKIIYRPDSLASGDVSHDDMMVYSLHRISDCDIVLQFFCTFPLLSSKSIDRAIEKFVNDKSEEQDSFMLVTELEPSSLMTKDGEKILGNAVVDTHCLYGAHVGALLENKSRIGNNPMMIPVSRLESLNVKTKLDADIARRILESNE